MLALALHGYTNQIWQEFDSIRSAKTIHLPNRFKSIILSSTIQAATHKQNLHKPTEWDPICKLLMKLIRPVLVVHDIHSTESH